MARNELPLTQLAPMVLVKFTQGFREVDYSMAMGGPFEFAVPLQAFQQEAGAKGCGVVVQVALVPIDELLPKDLLEKDED